jgi:predicted dehydrogenase
MTGASLRHAGSTGVGHGVTPGNERTHTMPDQVRVGVVGTSGFTDFVHLTDLKSHPRASVTAICGRRDRQRAAELAATYDIPHIYTDYHEMLARAPLDAVIVAAPDDLHYPIVMAALDAGLHVLCEKPLRQ